MSANEVITLVDEVVVKLDAVSKKLHTGHNMFLDGISIRGQGQNPTHSIRVAGEAMMRDGIKDMENDIIPLVNRTKKESESALTKVNGDKFLKNDIDYFVFIKNNTEKMGDMMATHATNALKAVKKADKEFQGLQLIGDSYNDLFDNILNAKKAALDLKEKWLFISSKNSNSNSSSGGRRKRTHRHRKHKRTHRNRRRTHRK